MKSLIKASWTIFLKDIKTEIRSKEYFGSTFMFALLIIVIINFTFPVNNKNTPLLASGILWVSFIFSGTIGLNRSFMIERENDCIYGLSLTPIDRMAIYWGKLLGNLIMLTIIELMLLPIFTVLYNFNILKHFFLLPIVLLLGNLGFMSIGTLLAAMSVNIKAREILLPVLLLPLLIPLIIWAAGATSVLMEDKNLDKYFFYIKLLSIFDIIFFLASSILFEFIMDDL